MQSHADMSRENAMRRFLEIATNPERVRDKHDDPSLIQTPGDCDFGVLLGAEAKSRGRILPNPNVLATISPPPPVMITPVLLDRRPRPAPEMMMPTTSEEARARQSHSS